MLRLCLCFCMRYVGVDGMWCINCGVSKCIGVVDCV